jgi:hypothetical protein
MLQVPLSLVSHVDPRSWETSYFGPLGALAIAPTALIAMRTIRTRRLTFAARLALAIPLFIVALALVYRFNPWIGRLMLIPVVLAAPLLAGLHRHRRYATAVAGVGVISLFLSVTQNTAKPSGLFGGPSIWNMSRPQAQAIESPSLLPYLVAARDIPSHTVVGYAIGDNDLDYPLYGSDLTRALVRLPPPVWLATAASEHIKWVFVKDGYVKRGGQARWRVTKLGGSGFELFTREGPVVSERAVLSERG